MSDHQLAYLTDCGALAVTAEMVGAGSAILELTGDYANNAFNLANPLVNTRA